MQLCGGALASWLVCVLNSGLSGPGLSPGQRYNMLCSWVGH